MNIYQLQFQQQFCEKDHLIKIDDHGVRAPHSCNRINASIVFEYHNEDN